MYFLSIKNFKHLHEKVLERDMHARMQNSYARGRCGEGYLELHNLRKRILDACILLQFAKCDKFRKNFIAAPSLGM